MPSAPLPADLRPLVLPPCAWQECNRAVCREECDGSMSQCWSCRKKRSRSDRECNYVGYLGLIRPPRERPIRRQPATSALLAEDASDDCYPPSGLRQPGVGSDDGGRRLQATRRSCPPLVAESAGVRERLCPDLSAFCSGGSKRNNFEGPDASALDSARSHGPDSRGAGNRSTVPHRGTAKARVAESGVAQPPELVPHAGIPNHKSCRGPGGGISGAR